MNTAETPSSVQQVRLPRGVRRARPPCATARPGPARRTASWLKPGDQPHRVRQAPSIAWRHPSRCRGRSRPPPAAAGSTRSPRRSHRHAAGERRDRQPDRAHVQRRAERAAQDRQELAVLRGERRPRRVADEHLGGEQEQLRDQREREASPARSRRAWRARSRCRGAVATGRVTARRSAGRERRVPAPAPP